MKKVFFMYLASVGLILASCGGGDEKSSESAKTTEASGKEQNKEPQTACDCIKNVNNEMKKILKMSLQEISEKFKSREEFELKMDKMLKTGKCEDLMKNAEKEYATSEAFMKVCPEMKEMMETIQQFQNMGARQTEGYSDEVSDEGRGDEGRGDEGYGDEGGYDPPLP